MRIMGGFTEFVIWVNAVMLSDWQFGIESHGGRRSITGVHVDSVIPKRLKRRGRRPIVIFVHSFVTSSRHDW